MPANSSTARTGTAGKAVVDSTLVARVKIWNLAVTSPDVAWGDSDSEGFTVRLGGRKDATGSMTGAFDTGTKVYTLFMPADIVELVLFETATDYWALPRALIINFNVSYNQDTKEVVEWSADYGCDGQYYHPGEAGAPAHSLP